MNWLECILLYARPPQAAPFLDESCMEAHAAAPHQCWSSAYHYPYINTPLFVSQNKFDSNQAGAIFGLDWWSAALFFLWTVVIFLWPTYRKTSRIAIYCISLANRQANTSGSILAAMANATGQCLDHVWYYTDMLNLTPATLPII